MNPLRLAYGSLHHDGAGVLPSQTEGLDCLLLDGGQVAGADAAGSEALVGEAFERLGRSFYLDAELSVLASLGGGDPRLVARAIAAQLREADSLDLPLGVVRGCDVTDRLEEFLADGELAHQQTGQPLLELRQPIQKAVLSLGCEPMLEALNQFARVVLVGHTTAAQLAAAAAAHHFRAAGQRERLVDQAAGLGEQLAEWQTTDPQPRAGDADLFAPPGVSVALSDDGQISFFGPGAAPISKRQREATSSPLPCPAAYATLEILYREAFVARAVVECADSEIAATWFSDAWTGSPVVRRWSWWRPESSENPLTPERSVLGVVELRHAERPVVEAAARRLRQVAAIAPQTRLVALPSVVADEHVWPTSIPAEWIEWAVDVRPARDWLD